MGGQRATTTDDEEAGSKKKFGVAVHNSRVGEKKEVKKGTPLVLIYPYDFKLRRLRRMTRFALSADLLCSVPHPSIYTRVVLPYRWSIPDTHPLRRGRRCPPPLGSHFLELKRRAA